MWWNNKGRGILAYEPQFSENVPYRVVYRIDSRQRPHRVDRSINAGPWEVIDDGQGFDSREAACCWVVSIHAWFSSQDCGEVPLFKVDKVPGYVACTSCIRETENL